mmetsp:Transcript_70919/g.189365  ORF Transcript_70919/g.189365 Transcript_70919/m.189365 type:complete len:251 (+) Transcript_70919:50-802(+)
MRPGRRWDSVGNFLRSDDRFYFFLAAFVFTASVLYTIFGQLIPAIQNYNVYTYAHCTVTGAGHWEKYGTWTGISERVVVPVEIRIGGFQGALNWDGNGTQIYASRDAYHQAIARDAPLGWKYFTVNDKIDYLHQYQPGHEYECWALPSEQFHEAVFHKQPGFERMIPQIIFLVIVVGLCMATGVCLGIVDMCRALVGIHHRSFRTTLSLILHTSPTQSRCSFHLHNPLSFERRRVWMSVNTGVIPLYASL